MLLPFDFYLPYYNLCIEFDGEQHFNSHYYETMFKENDILEPILSDKDLNRKSLKETKVDFRREA